MTDSLKTDSSTPVLTCPKSERGMELWKIVARAKREHAWAAWAATQPLDVAVKAFKAEGGRLSRDARPYVRQLISCYLKAPVPYICHKGCLWVFCGYPMGAPYLIAKNKSGDPYLQHDPFLIPELAERFGIRREVR